MRSSRLTVDARRTVTAKGAGAVATAGALVLFLVGASGAAASGAVAPSGARGSAVTAARHLPLRLEMAELGRFESARLTPPDERVPAGPGSGYVVLGGSPGAPAANPKTDTVYVPIQCTTSFCSSSGTSGHVVDVINAATCNSKVSSGCRVVAIAKVGDGPLAVALDAGTDTLYVTNGNAGTVSVLNGARCNAGVTSGCGRPVATVKVGKFPVAAVVNPVTNTLYVANLGGSVSVIDTAHCNATVTSGCRQPGRTVTDKASPDWIDVNTATDTIYVANGVTPGTVSVIDGATCNGGTGSGCGKAPPTVAVGANPFSLAVDQAHDTVYVADDDNGFNEGAVSVINGATCNGHTKSGCSKTPPAVPTGIGSSFVVDDSALHTVFAVNSFDDTISAIDTLTCNGTKTSACAKRPPNEQATSLEGSGYNAFPGGMALIGKTGTAYVVTIGGRDLMSVTSIVGCNATDTSGCRAEAPAVPDGEFLLSADPSTDTLYGGNLNEPQIDVINGATCHASDLAGCAPVATIPMPDSGSNVGAIDQATHTLYASDESASGTVAVINTATCNAADTSGCSTPPPVIQIGAFPGPPALNPDTHTLYVAYGTSGNQVAVVDAATCNATDTSGCGQTPATVTVGAGTLIVVVSVATDTIYAPASGASYSGDTVAVINGATCNGTDQSGCGQLAATAQVGVGPVGAVVDDATHTLYVANNADGDAPGSVSIIDTATCNGTTTTGCAGPFPTAPAGNAPQLIAADTSTGTLYVTDVASALVTIINTASCDAADTSGCADASSEQAVGSGPLGIAVNPSTATVYVADGYLPGSMSILAASG